MLQARIGFDAVLLGDGTLLAVGHDVACHPGGAEPGGERAELFDPAEDTWVEVESLNKARKQPATVVLPDGSAMVLGGINSDDIPFSSTKVFSPEARTWVDGPLLDVARSTPLAASLPDGRVIVASGSGSGDPTTTEIYDARTSAWTAGPSLPPQTPIDVLVGLADGLVLGVGFYAGESEPSPKAIVYDPARDVWIPVEAPDQVRNGFAPLPDGGALAIGGLDAEEMLVGNRVMTDHVSRFDPESGRWTEVAPLSTPRIDAQIVTLDDGRVLVAGGATGSTSGTEGTTLSSTEIYDPASDAWVPGSDLLAPRKEGYAVQLADRTVLVLGGNDAFNDQGETPFCAPPLTTVERFYPGG